jgi:hypothetical protein
MAQTLDVSECPAASLTSQRVREILGREAEELSDEQIDQLRRQVQAMADLLIEIYLAGGTNNF